MPTNDTTSARDTHFLGFARWLQQEISQLEMQQLRTRTQSGIIYSGQELAEQIQLLIAQAAYDFAQHVIGSSLEYLHECGHELSGDMGKRILPTIPDMKNSPEEGECQRNQTK